MTLENPEAPQYDDYNVESFDGNEGEGTNLPTPIAKTDFDVARPPIEGEQTEGFEESSSERMGEAVTDFASIKFHRENTLLTNAERYSSSIREEAELYVKQLQSEVEALNSQADQRYDEARKIKEESEKEAERRIAEADQRVEEIHQEAYNGGFELGRQEGLNKRYEEAGPLVAHLESILEDLSQYRKKVDYYVEKDGVMMAILMAKTILNQEMKINKKAIWKIIAHTLSKMKGKGLFRVLLNPEDFKFANSAGPQLKKFINEDQTLKFRADPELLPGNAMIETDREIIDLTINNQLRHIEKLLGQRLGERESEIMSRPAPPIPAPQQKKQTDKTPQPKSEPAEAQAAQEPPPPENTSQDVAKPQTGPASDNITIDPATPEHPEPIESQAAQPAQAAQAAQPAEASQLPPENING